MLRPLDNPLVFAERVLGVVPHAGQAAFLLDAAHHPVRVLIAGRRAGKSSAVAIEVAFQAVCHRVQAKPYRALITAPAVDQAKMLLASVSKFLRASPLGGLIEKETASPFPEIALSEDVTIAVRAASEKGKHLRGHSADAVYVDEAGFLSEQTIEEAIMPTLADVGGRLILVSTPTTRGGLLHRLFERGRAGDARVGAFHFTSLDNPHVDRSYVEAQRDELTAAQFATEYGGEFADASNALFLWSDIVACSEGESGRREDARHVIGFDPAKVRDGSAVVVLDRSTIPRRVVHLEDLARCDYAAQVARVAALAREYDARVVLDATGGGQVLADMLRNAGAMVVPIVFTATRKSEIVTSLAVAIEKHELAFPPDRRLLDELRWFTATRAGSGQTKFEAAPGARDDFVCALALALNGAGGVSRPMSFAEAGFLPFLTTSSPMRLDPAAGSWEDPWITCGLS